MEKRTSDNDLGYFDLFPAPIYEAMCRINPAENINATTPFYGPLLYVLARINGAHRALEVGVAEGWSSGFLAWAIKDNNIRYGMGGRFYGIDIGDKRHIQKQHEALGLPSTFIEDPKGSVHWLENQKEIEPESLDIVFIDGLHYGPYVEREVELVYPFLKGDGQGLCCLHDVYSTAEKAWPLIKNNPKYQWESMRFMNNYGFGILRKMDGTDSNKVHWPEGDQKELAISQGVCDKDGKLV